MNEQDWFFLQCEADYSNLLDDGFSEAEANEIMERVKNGEDINEVVLEYADF